LFLIIQVFIICILKVCAFNDIGQLNGELQVNDPRFSFMVLGVLITTVNWTNCSVAGRINCHVFWVICTRMGIKLWSESISFHYLVCLCLTLDCRTAMPRVIDLLPSQIIAFKFALNYNQIVGLELSVSYLQYDLNQTARIS